MSKKVRLGIVGIVAARVTCTDVGGRRGLWNELVRRQANTGRERVHVGVQINETGDDQPSACYQKL